METLLRDLRYGLRVLLKQKGFTAVAVFALALGISANTAIFSVVNAVLLRSLPYKDADSLVVPVTFNAARDTDRGSITYADYLDWKNETQVFESVAAFSSGTADLTGSADPERIEVAAITEDYFAVMGVPPQIGSTFSPSDFELKANRTLVISFRLWQRRFGGDPGILQQDVYLNGRPYPVIGVMPKDSQWPETVDIWLPLAVGPNPGPDLMRRDNMIFGGVARLKPGVPIEQATAAMETIARRLEQDFPESRAGWSNRAIPLREYIVGDQLHLALLVLLAAVGFVLLIACVNVANLLLARAATREREIAVRLALGAGRLRLILQLLTESAALALLGGGVGLVLAFWGVDLLASLAPKDLPGIAEAKIDLRVLAFTMATSVVTAVLFGLVPALHASKVNLNESLKEGGRSSAEGARGGRIRSVLVVSEVVLSFALLAGASLMVRSFMRLQQVDPGFNTNNLATMAISCPSSRYPDNAKVIAFYKNVVDRVAASPGVESAAVSSALPLGGGGFYLGRVFLIEGHPEPPAGPDHPAQWNVIGPGFFETEGIGIIKGRTFDERDTAEGNQVIIINESMAREMFPNDDALGKRIRSWRDENLQREIVGVVKDVRYFGREDDLRGLVYVPHTQNTWRSMLLSVRTTADPASLIQSIRDQIWSVDRNLAIANPRTMNQILAVSVAPRRFSMMLLTSFAAIAMMLSSVGIYSVLSYSVAQRSHELGVRMALGAKTGDIMRLVVAHGMKLTCLGAGIGMVSALALTRLMKSLLYEVSATDPASLIVACGLLVALGVVACLVPARRATKVDPMVALRYE
ncbi:MAG TPA: ABC transporter permease [Blastocatellia bacterium]|jgi:putative ABC transport system permease protein|nr:ABC transporter permease [Blastocatellia bacterium]